MKKNKVKDCFGEETMIEYELGRNVEMDIVDALIDNYDVQLFKDFPKPFFRIHYTEKFLLTGVVGLDTIRVTYRQNCEYSEQEKLESILNNFIEKNQTVKKPERFLLSDFNRRG